MRESLFAAVLVLLGASVPAQAPLPEKTTIYGSGTISCGKWTADNDHRILNLSWVLGFISGLDRAAPADVRQTDVDAIEQWLNQYCRQNPLSKLSDATFKLLQALDTPSLPPVSVAGTWTGTWRGSWGLVRFTFTIVQAGPALTGKWLVTQQGAMPMDNDGTLTGRVSGPNVSMMVTPNACSDSLTLTVTGNSMAGTVAVVSCRGVGVVGSEVGIVNLTKQ